MMKRFKLLIATLLLLVVSVAPALACTGKTVTIARTDDLQQQILAQMLAVLIDARTGTTVEEKVFASAGEAHAAVLKHEADLGIEYTGVIRVQTLNKEMIGDAAALYTAVKEEYDQELNLLTLPPLGFNNRQLAPAGGVAEGVIVLRKDTWTKFPALDKLITKLSGKIDDTAMRELEERAAKEEIKTVVRDFLRANRLLF